MVRSERINEWGVGHKTGIKLYIYHPINLQGGDLELHRNFTEIAPRALNILSDLAENAESESVRLGATRDLLDRAGFRPVDRHEIVKEKSVEELNTQLVSLVGENGAEMLISAFRSRRSISGPELAG